MKALSRLVVLSACGALSASIAVAALERPPAPAALTADTRTTPVGAAARVASGFVPNRGQGANAIRFFSRFVTSTTRSNTS
jgi:hypothetical protein